MFYLNVGCTDLRSVQRQQQLTQHFAGSCGGNAALVQHGGQLVHIRADDVCFGYGANGSQQLQEANSARFGGSGSGECRWIQAVKVDCQVNRHICLAQPIGQFLQTGEIELVNIGMAGGKLEFFPIAAADTELVDAAIAQKVMAAAQHTGMAELCAEIVIPQVGVSVKMDTANYEPENTDDPEWRAIYEKRCKEAGFSAYFDYSWQWAYKKKFEDAGLTALLGCGFDPGVTQAYCAYAAKHEFDTIDTIDILDCNGGDHGYAFATNFNPEINLREVSAPGSYMENGKWVEIPAMSIKREYNFDQVGQKDMYLLHHEEIESLGKNLPDVKRIRFFMTFGQSYLDHMRCLEDVGMLSTTPINFNGQEIVPIQFLKALLPDPASLGPRTKGKTNIGCIFTGKKDGKDKTYYIYNVCDHQECYREVGSQAISYTTGVPAMCGALMMLTGEWTKPGVYTVEEFNPDPFLDALDKYGLPRSENHSPVLVD